MDEIASAGPKNIGDCWMHGNALFDEQLRMPTQWGLPVLAGAKMKLMQTWRLRLLLLFRIIKFCGLPHRGCPEYNLSTPCLAIPLSWGEQPVRPVTLRPWLSPSLPFSAVVLMTPSLCHRHGVRQAFDCGVRRTVKSPELRDHGITS